MLSTMGRAWSLESSTSNSCLLFDLGKLVTSLSLVFCFIHFFPICKMGLIQPSLHVVVRTGDEGLGLCGGQGLLLGVNVVSE